MSHEFKLPDLGEGIAEAELRRWLVHEGDRVAEHQAVVEVETDKALVEVPSPRGGIVQKLLRREGEVVRVGETLLVIGDEGESVLPPRPRSVGIVGELPEAEGEEEILATPMVRKLARERGIDLSKVRGSGPRGNITPEDLEKTGAPAPAFGPGERRPLRGVRRTVARNVMTSQERTAAVTCTEEADITPLWELREREQRAAAAKNTHLTFLPFIIKAAQHALREYPIFNAAIDDDREEIVLTPDHNFGIAVETVEGLMVPVIREVEKKSILDLAAEIQELGEKARARTIALAEMQGHSFTITNYGHYGGIFATPIINWPDVAILGCGRIAERPWVVKGEIAVRRILPLSLTFDHRVADGAEAALFLRKIAEFLEDPALLFIESV